MEMANYNNNKLREECIHTTFRAGWEGANLLPQSGERTNYDLANDITRPRLSMVPCLR